MSKPRVYNNVHKATPSAENPPGHCLYCGQRVKPVPGGEGMTFVHSDTGAVTAPNPPGLPTDGRYQAQSRAGHDKGTPIRVWGVYDTEKKAWPAIVGGYVVPTGLTQEQAEIEADKLNAKEGT